jgi:DNA-binding MarR family transcriptional regulator
MIPPGITGAVDERRQGGTELTPLELAAWRGMLRLVHRLRRELGAELRRRHGLSMADYDALLALAGQPDKSIRMSVLAETILQPRSSLTRIVDSLEQRGLVQRMPTEDDAREVGRW